MGPVVWRAMVALFLLLAGCGGDTSTRFCFGSETFCEDVFARNQAPRADAGPDREATSGADVVLDGSDSDDDDGRVAAYAWAQESGPAVALGNATHAVVSFTAPEVARATDLVFRLTVTDDDGASDTDLTRITVLPAATAATALPGAAAATRTGLELLTTRYLPSPLPGLEPCCTDETYLGLWLGARVLGHGAGLDDDLNVLLDELRMLAQARLPAASGDMPRLLHLGYRALACLTEELDPATAELARRAAGPGGIVPADWMNAIARTYPALAGDAVTELPARAQNLLEAVARGMIPQPALLAAATATVAASLNPAGTCLAPGPG